MKNFISDFLADIHLRLVTSAGFYEFARIRRGGMLEDMLTEHRRIKWFWKIYNMPTGDTPQYETFRFPEWFAFDRRKRWRLWVDRVTNENVCLEHP